MPIRRSRNAVPTMLIAIVAATSALFLGCSDEPSIRVFAASSLQDVLPEILDAYADEHDNVTFEVQYGGSQALASQIVLGAEVDLFVSANPAQADRLDEGGFIADRRDVVTNSLVIVVEEDSAITGLDDLAGDDVRVAIGAPEVPVGALTQRLFDALDGGLADGIRANVITEDPNVRIVLSRVELGEADAAFVYRTDVPAADGVRAIELDVPLEPNVYVGAVIDGASDEAATLLEFLGSAVAEPIWRAAGFEAVSGR